MYENNRRLKKYIFSVENQSCEDGIYSYKQTICFQGKFIFIRLVVFKEQLCYENDLYKSQLSGRKNISKISLKHDNFFLLFFSKYNILHL
jgi:hypothetical protein